MMRGGGESSAESWRIWTLENRGILPLPGRQRRSRRGEEGCVWVVEGGEGGRLDLKNSHTKAHKDEDNSVQRYI